MKNPKFKLIKNIETNKKKSRIKFFFSKLYKYLLTHKNFCLFAGTTLIVLSVLFLRSKNVLAVQDSLLDYIDYLNKKSDYVKKKKHYEMNLAKYHNKLFFRQFGMVGSIGVIYILIPSLPLSPTTKLAIRALSSIAMITVGVFDTIDPLAEPIPPVKPDCIKYVPIIVPPQKP